MMTLQDAWAWYAHSKKAIVLLRRLAVRHWNRLPWDGELGKDEFFKNLEAPLLMESADHVLSHLHDMAVVLLFSVFEAEVRERVLIPVELESGLIRHPSLRFAAGEIVETIRTGSFHKVLDTLKTVDPDLVEQVRQVRRYRNWVSHGKRGTRPSGLDPRMAYERLGAFLRAIERTGDEITPRGEDS